jgi:serine O-acetyltransferase
MIKTFYYLLDKLFRKVAFYFHFVLLLLTGHILTLYLHPKRKEIEEDIDRFCKEHKIGEQGNTISRFVFLMKNKKYFRNLFYYRIRPRNRLLIPLYPHDKSLSINSCNAIGTGLVFHHPYCTILNAKAIGKNCTVRHLTTVGNKFENDDYRPTILDNVNIGSGVTIIGDITIGNNCVIGAGAVVVKSIEDNCVVGGNPARILRRIDPNEVGNDK